MICCWGCWIGHNNTVPSSAADARSVSDCDDHASEVTGFVCPCKIRSGPLGSVAVVVGWFVVPGFCVLLIAAQAPAPPANTTSAVLPPMSIVRREICFFCTGDGMLLNVPCIRVWGSALDGSALDGAG